jgi:vacuolar-type H+-ATPase subunit H
MGEENENGSGGDTVIVNTGAATENVEAAIEAAEERADNAERTAELITDAAINSAVVEQVQETVEQCQTQTESVVGDAHERMSALEARMELSLTSQQEFQATVLSRLEALTPPPSPPTQTQEGETDPSSVVVDAPPAQETPPENQPRKKRFGWI